MKLHFFWSYNPFPLSQLGTAFWKLGPEDTQGTERGRFGHLAPQDQRKVPGSKMSLGRGREPLDMLVGLQNKGPLCFTSWIQPRRAVGPKQNGCVRVRWSHRVFHGSALHVAQSSKAIDEVSHWLWVPRPAGSRAAESFFALMGFRDSARWSVPGPKPSSTHEGCGLTADQWDAGCCWDAWGTGSTWGTGTSSSQPYPPELRHGLQRVWDLKPPASMFLPPRGMRAQCTN